MLPQFDNAASNTMREAIAQVLSAYLEPQKVSAALDIWDKKYDVDGTPTNALTAYAKEVSQSVNLNRQSQHSLRVALYQTLYSPKGSKSKTVAAQPRHHPSMPTPKPNPGQSESVSYRLLNERTPGSPASAVFAEVGERMIEGAQKAGYKEFTEFTTAVQDYLSTLSLGTLAKQNLLDWCSHKDSLLRGNLPDKNLPGIIHMIYRALCEAVGPVIADAVLGHAINKAQALPEATLYPPKRLL